MMREAIYGIPTGLAAMGVIFDSATAVGIAVVILSFLAGALNV